MTKQIALLSALILIFANACFQTNSSNSMEFVTIRSGTFEMGCVTNPTYRCDSDESPVHTVTITRDFELQTTPVTQAQWLAVMGSNPSLVTNCLECPAENMSWDDTQVFVAKLSSLDPNYNYRLPTEAEWEYADRCGTRSVFPWGNSAERENLRMPMAAISPVKSYPANACGLYDMNGHLWQWVQDWYNGTYPADPQTDPTGPSEGRWKLARGGGPWHEPRHSSASSRHADLPNISTAGVIGLRLVREAKAH